MKRYFGCRGSVSLLTLTNFLVANVLASGENGDSDRGFGHLYKWVTVTAAFEEAKRHGKPVFVLIHKAWCPACQKLKPKFANSIKLLDLSNQFVMVNVENNEEWLGKQGNFQPDGKYVPRILFFTPDGELIREAYNRHPSHDPAYRYFYTSPAQIADTMIHILNTHFRKSLPVVAESSTPENLRFRRDESDASTSPEDEAIVERPTLLE